MFLFRNHPDHASLIAVALREYLARPQSYFLPVEAELFAKTLHALPAYADIGAALFIRPQGSVLSISTNQVWSEHSEWETISDMAWINAAYLSAIQIASHPHTTPSTQATHGKNMRILRRHRTCAETAAGLSR